LPRLEPAASIESTSAQRWRNAWAGKAPFPDPFTRDEVEAIIDYMTERHPDGVANYVEFKFFSGLRPSETTALR
jgi:integrase